MLSLYLVFVLASADGPTTTGSLVLNGASASQPMAAALTANGADCCPGRALQSARAGFCIGHISGKLEGRRDVGAPGV